METIENKTVGETIFYEQLPNGLKVYILPKPGFSKVYAIFTTKYGSIDNHFQVEGQEEMRVPDGIAHFLEHKMFEEPEGDIFTQFASQGASANAFTSFDRTSYLFSTTGNILKNLKTLINFVQNPYFTDENVEKEKGIIGQEIQMYQDQAEWRSYFGLIEAMYTSHPVHIDIAGTIESISKITKDTLYDCYHTFYHPSNMSLFIVGGVETDLVMHMIRTNQANKNWAPQGEIKRFFENEPTEVNQREKITILPVSLPKCMFGLKEEGLHLEGEPLLRRELETKLIMDILLSSSSSIYQMLYDQNLISDNFGHEYNISKDYAFSVIGGDTKDPAMLIDKVKEEVNHVIAEGLNAADFERSKRKKIGGFLRMLNSPESIANEFTKYQFHNINLFDILAVYESITLDDAYKRMKEHFNWDRLAVSIVKSEAS